ncbi:MAG: hypothetical protein JNK15_03150 [Planctomycetes bacterium]|nr:hypothetical protein [Planctomycetota bacterium]
MTEIRYGDLELSPPSLRVTTIGTLPGPPAGDGWTMVAKMRQATMPAGAGTFAFVVSGQIGDMNLVGSGWQRGVLQLCLGTEGGTKHTEFRIAHSVLEFLNWKQGIPFQFLVLVHPSYPDALFGTSFNPSTTRLAVYARTLLNGDAQTYASEFTIANLTWQWWDLTRIPAGHWAADEVGTQFIVPTTSPVAFQRVAPAAWGSFDESWLHYANVWYQARGAGQQAPRFMFGITPDGSFGAFSAKVGTGGRWGQNRYTLNNLGEPAHLQQGCFWTHTNASAGTRPGYTVQEPVGTIQSLVYRYRTFGVRIDTLPDVIIDGRPPVAAGVAETGAWHEQFVTTERPEPSPGILTDPIVMVHQVPSFGPAQAAYCTRVTEAGNGRTFRIGASECFPLSDPQRGEAVSAMAFGRRQFQTTSPAMQFRSHLVGEAASPPTLQQARDFSFVMFHPVRDPENLTTPPGSLPSPIVVTPGKQSLDAASLSPPPTAPNANPQERGVGRDRQQIQGATGYARRWPLGSKVVRAFSLGWGPLSLTSATAVRDFLRANPAWRYTPPRGAAIAVLCSSPPELIPIDPMTASVAVDVVVLAFTGA